MCYKEHYLVQIFHPMIINYDVVFLPGWSCTLGPHLNSPLQVDAGLGQVVATDTNHQAYFLSGSSWTRLPEANMKHISVGQAGIWATHVSDYIFKYVGSSWAQVPGKQNIFQLQLLLCT